MKPPNRIPRTAAALAFVTAVSAAFLAAPGVPTAVASAPGDRDVTAELFEWKYDSVAKECKDTLGPAGYGYVEVSPATEHVQGPQWWTSYQPVSYKIAGRLGDRTSFKNMVDACHAAGVKVVADAVINHMAAGSGTGTGGSSYTKYNYPGIYQSQDMDDCTSQVGNYSDRWNVQHCELVGLADLDTNEPYVRTRIAQYLNDLLSLGVDGLRIDAAKHIATEDIAAIKAQLANPSAYVKQEVIYGAGEAVQPTEYLPNGDVQEFRYGRDLKRVFTSEKLAYLKNFGEGWGYLSSAQAGVFVDNWDTERNGSTLTYKDGANYTLANVFMLAWPYGSPDVHSGYEFSDNDAGPPNGGTVQACWTDGWKCQHKWPEIQSMVAFHNAARGQSVTNWWDNGNNQIAFGRGSKAYVAINHESSVLTRTFQTSLPAGAYCDVQSGKGVTVDSSGQFTATLGANTALALQVNSRTCAGS
ncbi:alpha-amylase family protein [Streptomyces violascens]|uniref:alpha-amylase n=1 Tax=Streptomyces violascens TaxID=67381 RepID=UPI00366397EB